MSGRNRGKTFHTLRCKVIRFTPTGKGIVIQAEDVMDAPDDEVLLPCSQLYVTIPPWDEGIEEIRRPWSFLDVGLSHRSDRESMVSAPWVLLSIQTWLALDKGLTARLIGPASRGTGAEE